MEARNRKIEDWYGKIKRSEIRLPRFQRREAWDSHRICSLLKTVVDNLPLGITLVLEVGEKEQFISRCLVTAPETNNRTIEHLLDGQQRLTALWRAFHNNYEWETYYVYVKEFDNYDKDEERNDMALFFRGRYPKNGSRYPLWCDKPDQCLRRGFIPTDLLKPENIQDEIDDWIEAATAPLESENAEKEEIKKFYDYQKRISDVIKDLRSTIANYNLPYLSLPSHTDKSVALNVFINMNTNSKPLSTYDIIVAEVESVMGQSLHDLQDALHSKHPNIARYFDLSNMILTTSALLQSKLPNQRGAWDMDKRIMVENWEIMESGLNRMSYFLTNEGIFDKQRLPTNAILAVIAALYQHIPESGDQRGRCEQILKKYMWHSFFTDRYENSAASHAYADYIALDKVMQSIVNSTGLELSLDTVPIFKEHSLVDEEELLTADWPKRASIRGRAVMAVACRLGALDFSTGERIDAINIAKRHYHHIYPDALLKEAEIESFLALNCSLITDTTNMAIGRKDPVNYMKDRYQWTSAEIVNERLQSHIIPIEELANGGYEGLSAEKKTSKLKIDYSSFLRRRAKLIMKAVRLLASGHQLSPASIWNSNKDDASVTFSSVINNGESEKLEFKSTLRTNLFTGEKDSRMELAVLKTLAAFLNSDGGVLIIGLADDGKPLGLDADKFQNEDKIGLHLVNIVTGRISPKAMSRITIRFETLDDKRIMVLDCKKSNDAVFVKDDNIERFYIRTGPATKELTASQTQNFIKDRFI